MDMWKEMELKKEINRIRFEIWVPTVAQWKELSENARLLQQFIDECEKAIGDCEETLRVAWEHYDDVRRRSQWQPELKKQAKQLELYIEQKENEVELLLDVIEQAKDLLWELRELDE